MKDFIAENKFSIFYMLLLVAMPLLFSSMVLFYLIFHQEYFNTISHYQWALYYVLSVVTMALAFTPTTFIALITGYFLGFKGALFAIPAYMLASYFGFSIAKLVDKGKLLSAFSENEKVAAFLHNLKQKEFSFIILSRLSPVLPFALMNFILSAMQVRFSSFIFAGTIGMLPRTLLFIWVGSRGNDLKKILENPNQENFMQFVTIGLIIISVIGITRIITNAIKKV